MTDDRKVHVKPWKHTRQRRRLYGRWPGVIGWLCILPPFLGAAAFVLEDVRFLGLMTALLAIPRWPILGPGFLFGFWLAIAGAFLAVMIALRLYGGLCLVRRNPKGRGILLAYATGMLIFVSLAALSLLAQGKSRFDIGHAFGIELFWVLIPPAVLAIWPLFVLLWLRHPTIRRQMASWPGAPEPTQPPQTPAPAPPPPKPIEHPGWWKQWSD